METQKRSMNADEVHVWRIRLDIPISVQIAACRVLSELERQRAARFRFARDRRKYEIAHCALRSILGEYTGRHPQTVTITSTPDGKPCLPGLAPFRFNLSHSGELAVVAVAVSSEVGVDVEQIRCLDDYASLAQRFFSSKEVLAILHAPRELQLRLFFRCWVQKEAFVKALGQGLSYPLDSFDVAIGADTSADLVATRLDPEAQQSWKLCDLPLEHPYVGALAMQRPLALRVFDWSCFMSGDT